MERKATTFRIDPVAKAGLFKLGAILHKSLNQLANEAITEYVDRRIAEVEGELESTLEDLRAYRRRDPNFDQSIAKFIEAELSVRDDPAEGSVFIEEGEVGPPGKVGPAQKAVIDLLND